MNRIQLYTTNPGTKKDIGYIKHEILKDKDFSVIEREFG
jgi:hypothetical protein